jgi:predicted MFS family arabinose efflux permease
LGVVANVLLLDALPSAPGAAMALQSAGMEVGWGTGAALAGGLLAIGGYGAVYSGLGLVLPLGPIPLAARARRRAAAPGPRSANAPAG